MNPTQPGFDAPPADVVLDTPEQIHALASQIKAVAVDPVIGERLATTGQVLNIGNPDEFAASIEAQRAQLAVMAKHLGVTS